MSFDLTRLNKYLPDEATDTYVANGVVNSYAPVTAITTNSITIDNSKRIDGDHKQFTVGTEIFIHVSGSRDGTSKAYLGYWAFASILAVSDNTLTIDRDITGTIPARVVSDYYLQAITVPFFTAINTSNPINNDIAPPAFDVDKMCGGIVVIKAVTLNMNSHKINLADKGIPTTHKNLRPWFEYEQQGMIDTDKYAGWENAMLAHRLPLNSGDGAALLYASSPGSFSTLYVGNAVANGVKYCRGASDSLNKPNNVTNIGGSTVLMIGRSRTENIRYNTWGRKYRSTNSDLGQGLGARMFVTSNVNGINFNDGGLYSHMRRHKDLPSNLRLSKIFGDGTFGNVTDTVTAQKQMNNYALITTTSENANFLTQKIAYTRKTTTGLAPIQAGALVLVEIFNSVTGQTLETTLCNVLADNGSTLTLDKQVDLGTNRTGMIVSVPQFKNFTLAGTNLKTPKYSNGIGGIFAIAVSNNCDLSEALISVVDKGGVATQSPAPYWFENPDALPLGSGNGSILILAKNLTMSTTTRLGMIKNTGNKLGGRGVNGSVTASKATVSPNAQGGGYRGGNVEDSSNLGGHGGGGGTGAHAGGYCSNGTRDADITNLPNMGLQGAHLMIIADKITNFNIDAISTGGIGTASGTTEQGGAGYGGGGAGNGAGGGYRGGGAGDFASGGAAGYAYIYCNNAVNQITDGIILPE